MHLILFAEFDWSQTFLGGLIVCGGILVLLALIYFYRAMTAGREESKAFEEGQNTYLGALMVGAALIVSGIYFWDSTNNSSVDSSSLSSYTDFVSKEGRFKASFPSIPKQKTQTALGMKFNMFLVEEKEGEFGVAYFDLPGSMNPKVAQIDSALTNARNGMLKNVGATLVKEDRISLQGKYPGREIKADIPSKNVQMYCSIYLVNNRAYQVLIIGKQEWLNSDKARKFLNSFALR